MRQITLNKLVNPVSSLGGSALAVFAATLACFMSAAPMSALGSTNVFNDAVFWFRGGKDLSDDGCMQQHEFYDDLHADDNNHQNHNTSMVNYLATSESRAFKENAAFVTEQVVFPALGKSAAKDMQVLRLSNKPVTSGGNRYFWPETLNPRSVFVNNNIEREYTIVSRMRLDDDGLARTQCVFKIGYKASDKKGLWLGFSELQNSTKSKYITGHVKSASGNDTAFSFRNLQIPTNTWFDLAVVVGNGKLRIGVALPESLAIHGNNSTIAFAEGPISTDSSLSTGDDYRLFCYTGQTTYKLQSEADLTCFIGSVQQMAIWKRTLTDQEVMEAFGMPRPAIFRTGLDNGESTEFGGERPDETDVSQTIDGLGSWQNIFNTMKVGDIWTVNFTALRDEAGLAQIFAIQSLPDSATAMIEPKLNGQSLGEMRVAKNGRAFWPVPENLIADGNNTLVIERKNGGSGDFRMDAMELGGALGVGAASNGIDDGRVGPEIIATGVPSAADPNPAHWPIGFRPYDNNTNLYFRVWVDPEIVGACTSRFWTCVKCVQHGSTRPSGNEYFTIFVNENAKINFHANGSWKDIALDFNPGELHGGWNDFEIRAAEAYSTLYWQFDRYRFETLLRHSFSIPLPGMSIIIR